MALEDALNDAHRAADGAEARMREERVRKRKEDAELKGLLLEAVERLRPFGNTRLRLCKPSSSWFGADRSIVDTGGRRWRLVNEQRCWIIVKWAECPVLLVEDGTLGQVTEENTLACRESDVIAVKGALGPYRQYSEFRARIPNGYMSYLVGDFDIEAVKRTLAKAIVAHEKKYGRGAGPEKVRHEQ